MKKPYKKLALYTKLSAAGILISMFLALIPVFILLILDKDKTWIGGILFFVIWVALIVVDFFVFKRLISIENRKRAKYLTLNTDICSFDNLSVNNRTDLSKDISIFIYNERMFNTITLYKLTDVDSIKKMRKQALRYLKDNYEAARETNSRNRHHELKVQLYAIDDADIPIKFNQNFEQLLSIGYIEAFWIMKKGLIIMPMYNGKDMEVSSLKNYDDAVNKLIKIFNVTSISEQNDMY